MRSIRHLVMLWGALAWGLSGCSSSPFDVPLAELAERDFGALPEGERALLERADVPADATAAVRSAPVPPDAGVEAYVQAALERNPSIRAAKQRVLRLRERIPQVTSLDDPMLQVAPFGEMAETAAGEVQVMTSVSQRIPFPGKLDARGRVAAQDAAIAEQEVLRVRLSVAADTRRAYWSLYYAARAIETTTRSRDLVAQFREVAQAKYRSGRATQESVLRASVELNNLDNELIALGQRRATAEAMLNTLIDRPVGTPVLDPPPVRLARVTARLEDLLASAQQSNPAIKSVQERLARYREQRELARLGRYPDVTVKVSYNLVDDDGLSAVANGDDQWWVGFGVNLPIWQGRLEAAEREATRGLLETSGLLAGEQNQVAFRVQDAFVKVESQQRQALMLRDVIVPEASQAVEASLSGFRSGEVDFLTLIDNWRTLLNLELMHEASLAELERSFAELQEAVGHDLERAAGAPAGDGADDDPADASTSNTEQG